VLLMETVREIGILLFVFGPLDTIFKSGQGTRIDWVKAGVIAILGLVLIGVAVIWGSEE
jgi:hypothetical protein